MEQIIPYLIKVNIALIVLFSLYWLLVRNKSKFQLNRFYLLSLLLFAFLFPFLSFPVEFEGIANVNQFNITNNIYDLPTSANFDAFEIEAKEKTIDLSLILSAAYLLVAFLLLSHLIIELFRITKKIFAATAKSLSCHSQAGWYHRTKAGK